MSNGKKPTEVLKEEHQSVLQKLDALEDVINRLDERDEISSELKELAFFFGTEFWVHFSKEEEALFPEIEKFMPRESGPLGIMLMEHETLRNTNTKLQRAVNDYFSNSESAEPKGKIAEFGAHFIGTLRDHIDKEDNILFMMADMHLDQTQIDKVIKLFHEIESKGSN